MINVVTKTNPPIINPFKKINFATPKREKINNTNKKVPLKMANSSKISMIKNTYELNLAQLFSQFNSDTKCGAE